jgi:hypothetical protein
MKGGTWAETVHCCSIDQKQLQRDLDTRPFRGTATPTMVGQGRFLACRVLIILGMDSLLLTRASNGHITATATTKRPAPTIRTVEKGKRSRQ